MVFASPCSQYGRSWPWAPRTEAPRNRSAKRQTGAEPTDGARRITVAAQLTSSMRAAGFGGAGGRTTPACSRQGLRTVTCCSQSSGGSSKPAKGLKGATFGKFKGATPKSNRTGQTPSNRPGSGQAESSRGPVERQGLDKTSGTIRYNGGGLGQRPPPEARPGDVKAPGAPSSPGPQNAKAAEPWVGASASQGQRAAAGATGRQTGTVVPKQTTTVTQVPHIREAASVTMDRGRPQQGGVNGFASNGVPLKQGGASAVAGAAGEQGSQTSQARGGAGRVRAAEGTSTESSADVGVGVTGTVVYAEHPSAYAPAPRARFATSASPAGMIPYKQSAEERRAQEAVAARAQAGINAWRASMPVGSAASVKPMPVKPDLKTEWTLIPEHLEWFRQRGIGPEVLQHNRVVTAWRYNYETGKEEPAIAFCYYRGAELINVKFRHLPKTFQQVKGAERIMYGYNDVIGQDTLIIVEGEVDKLSLNQAGFWNVVSVPDGAPPAPKRRRPGMGGGDGLEDEEAKSHRRAYDEKFKCLFECKELIGNKVKIVIATDNDGPGQALGDELARRLGKERCWRVQWPQGDDAQAAGELGQGAANGVGAPYEAEVSVVMPDSHTPHVREHPVGSATVGAVPTAGDSGPLVPDGSIARDSGLRKDANEVLVKDGVDVLRALIDSADPFPVTGLYRFRDYYQEIYQHYLQPDNADLGVSTGWGCMDSFYKVVPGELSIVTGVPNSGKSEWLDALLTNLANQYHWCFALCSLEKRPRDHAKQLLEKYVGKPFHQYIDSPLPRMSREEVEQGLEWLEDHFHVIQNVKDEPPTVNWVLETARMAVMRYGIRGLIIDPYNELDHARPAYMQETEYVSHILSRIKRFAQMYGVHVWFVAHPRQLQQWGGQPPTLYDISGSANFINKADNGIVVHRDWDVNRKLQHQDPQRGDSKIKAKDPPKLNPHHVQILMRKVRNKTAGQIGSVTLYYDRPTGRYYDPNTPEGQMVDARQQQLAAGNRPPFSNGNPQAAVAAGQQGQASYTGDGRSSTEGSGQAKVGYAPHPASRAQPGVGAGARAGAVPQAAKEHASGGTAGLRKVSAEVQPSRGHVEQLQAEIESVVTHEVIKAAERAQFQRALKPSARDRTEEDDSDYELDEDTEDYTVPRGSSELDDNDWKDERNA